MVCLRIPRRHQTVSQFLRETGINVSRGPGMKGGLLSRPRKEMTITLESWEEANKVSGKAREEGNKARIHSTQLRHEISSSRDERIGKDAVAAGTGAGLGEIMDQEEWEDLYRSPAIKEGGKPRRRSIGEG